ncbi:LTA synthase family protein [Mesorhizobium sp. AaZ16]|uniref:LTA synthase family protein n=1 Tax=Mesorhizobium sp. AaZ16 TaxID=3402289 RepID=UPI00374EE554
MAKIVADRVSATREASGKGNLAETRRRVRLLRIAGSAALTLLVSAVLVFSVEWIVRGSLPETLLFFQQPFRPGWTTIILFALLIVFFDALLGRAYHALLVVAPAVLFLAFVGHQKAHYLGDPLYPTDFLYARQIVELTPLLVRERPLLAIMLVVTTIAAIALLVALWRFWRRKVPALPMRARAARLAVALPALLFFGSIMDYATFSWARDRLQIIPMMWDQKENYASNGFAIAFALNVPMAKVKAPEGYSKEAIEAVRRPVASASVPPERPDIIIVMSESFWDPTRLPGVTITPDPVSNVRAVQSGHVFSPEFGGMTANVEFEALTGFSNAFLPYGSIPYQQYVREPLPSLATFLKSQGYATRAIHPFEGWFWNRTPVYEAFGFDSFMSEENLPPLATRGPLVSDAALTEEIIRQAEVTAEPFFFFAVTLQSHGPYEPNRYPTTSHKVETSVSAWSRGSILTFAEGAADADQGLARLIEWAEKRERPTVIAFFGDHLPPLGPVFVETGFMKNPVAERKAPLAKMRIQHETPLVIWSNRKGPVDHLGSISPSFLPLHVLETAGMSHPYYTGFLGEMRQRYRVVDRNVLVTPRGMATFDWGRAKEIDPAIRDFRLLQFDIMFGKRHGEKAFFPAPKKEKRSTS